MTIRRNIEKTTKLTVEQYNDNLSNSSSALIAGRIGEIVVDITTDPAYPSVYIANNLGFLNPFNGGGGGNGTPGGANTQLQFNNQGNFGGIPSVTWNGTTLALGSNSAVRITGGSANTVLATDGAGNLSWTNTIANAGYANTSNTANVANAALSVAGANVVGAVGLADFATVANSVAGANVTGQVANAAFATQADNANTAILSDSTISVEGANVLGAVNLATYAETANSVAGANVFGEVAFAAEANAVAGANVIGTVASAETANTANTANIANVAYSVSGANVVGSVANATHAETANIANIATVAYSVDGANVSGQVANANFAEYANIVVGNNQPNILTLGNLLSLDVAGNAAVNAILTDNYLYANGDPINFNPNGTSNITQINAGTGLSGGGSSGAVILNIANTGVANGTFGSSNVVPVITVNDQGQLLTVVDTPISIAGTAVTSEVANAAYATLAATADSVAGANVSGEVANATFATTAGTAYSVAGGNVFGEVANANYASYTGVASTANIALVSYSVDGANVFGEVANAAYATIAGTAYAVDGANVSGTVANAAYALEASNSNTSNVALSVAGANVTGEVANAAYANIAGTAYSVAGANVTGTVANAAFATDADTANFANIASVAYSVDGANVTGEVANAAYANTANVASVAYSVAGANVTGEVANAGYATFAGTAYAVDGANVSGQVATANYAEYANIVVGNSQPNITSVGTLTSLTVNGLTSLGAVGNVSITGGVSGEVLTTDGTGNLTWQAAAAPIVRIPAIYFTAPVDGNNQTFSNTFLGSYVSGEDMSVFYNGALLEYNYYTLSGDTLTVNIPLVIGDSIDVTTQIASDVNPLTKSVGSFYSNVTQTSGGTTVANPMTVNNTVTSDGVTVVSGSRLTVTNAGTYNIQFSAQIVKTNASSDDFEIWLTQNGVNVPDSSTQLTVQGNGEAVVAAWNWVLPAAAGDYFEIQWWSSDIDAQMPYIAANAGPPSRPGIPSVIITVTQA